MDIDHRRCRGLAVGDREGLSDTREGSLGSESAHTYVLKVFSPITLFGKNPLNCFADDADYEGGFLRASGRFRMRPKRERISPFSYVLPS